MFCIYNMKSCKKTRKWYTKAIGSYQQVLRPFKLRLKETENNYYFYNFSRL